MGMGGNGKADLGKKNGNGNDAMGLGGSGNLKTHSRTPLFSMFLSEFYKSTYAQTV